MELIIRILQNLSAEYATTCKILQIDLESDETPQGQGCQVVEKALTANKA
jgi:hypothetical protein